MPLNIHELRLMSGYDIPQIGLGTWLIKPDEVGDALRMALDTGYNHIDCAMSYGNQQEIGHALSGIFGQGKAKRENIFVTSKIWNSFHSFAKASEAVDLMLQELRLPYLDLCLIHWPHAFYEGDGMFPKDEQGNIMYAHTDYLETYRALENAVSSGKVRSIGLSNFNTKQIQRVFDNCQIKPALLQVEIHPYLQQHPLLQFCEDHDMVMTGFSPLANNAHMFRKPDQPNLLEEPSILDIAKKHGKTPGQVVLRWAIQRGTVVIPKSTNRQRLEDNIHIWDFQLSESDMALIKALDCNLRILTLERDKSHPDYPFREDI